MRNFNSARTWVAAGLLTATLAGCGGDSKWYYSEELKQWHEDNDAKREQAHDIGKKALQLWGELPDNSEPGDLSGINPQGADKEALARVVEDKQQTQVIIGEITFQEDDGIIDVKSGDEPDDIVGLKAIEYTSNSSHRNPSIHYEVFKSGDAWHYTKHDNNVPNSGLQTASPDEIQRIWDSLLVSDEGQVQRHRYQTPSWLEQK